MKSEQERFNSFDDTFSIVRTFIQSVTDTDYQLPPYRADTRERDKALINFANSEPLLAGVLSSVVSRDANRRWTLIGPARSVSIWGNRLHGVDEGLGWRSFVSKMSHSYYSTNLGFAVEVGADKNGVPTALWSFDPTRVRLTGIINAKAPYMVYYPPTGQVNLFRSDVLHSNSLPTIQEEMRGAGYCAIERSVLMAKIMLGLVHHQIEKLNAAPGKGLALFKGIQRDEWEQAKAEAEAMIETLGARYYKGILSLFTANSDAEVDLLNFSNLPDNFVLKDFVEIIMQAYSLAFNYPVGEFWAISSGSFGRTGEHKLQQQQATDKGELEFSSSLQEQLRSWFLPPSLYYTFEERNDTGELNKADLIKAKTETLLEMYNAGRRFVVEGEEPLFSPKEIRQLFVEHGIIPPEWTEEEEEDAIVSLDKLRHQVLSNPNLISRVTKYPEEPIVAYSWNPPAEMANVRVNAKNWNWRVSNYLSDLVFPDGTLSVLWERGGDILDRRFF